MARDETLTYPPASDLNGEELASALLRMVMLSAQLGHARPEYTARDYCKHVTSPEAKFIRDLLTLSTEETCDRWFGGVYNAGRVMAEMVGERMAMPAVGPLTCG